MYQVFESGKPADEIGFPRLAGKGWICSKFNTLREAREYANNWLGAYAEGMRKPLQVGERYHFTGSDDYIEIKIALNDPKERNLVAAGNLYMPVELALRKLGFTVEHQMREGVIYSTAHNNGESYLAGSALELLGLIKLIEVRGWNWQTTTEEAKDFEGKPS